jgi:hypothetical protein
MNNAIEPLEGPFSDKGIIDIRIESDCPLTCSDCGRYEFLAIEWETITSGHIFEIVCQDCGVLVTDQFQHIENT